jgi:hypothetical protein
MLRVCQVATGNILELFTNAAAGYQRMFKPVKEVADQ